MNPEAFDLRTQPLENGLVLEASAGTGKTWTIASLVAREIALDDSLRIGNVMITTFTRAAAAELRERVRKRLIESAEHVDPDVPPGATKTSASSDPLFTLLCDADEPEKRLRAARLRRAALEFDTAIIGTIHSICSRILTLAGEPMPGMDEQHDDHRVVRELVNDALVAEAGEGRS
ncbi:MAG: UvrD-helicase domain-containing protein, partial [Armatimonadaceae bacterium]